MAAGSPQRAGAGEAAPGVPEAPQPAAIDTAALLQQVATAMTALVGRAEAGPQVPRETRASALAQFRKMAPPTYNGVADTDVAESFLEECEKILEAMEITEPATRISLTTFQLTGRASAWWNSVKDTGRAEGLGWEQFKERFRDHFFPPSLREAKREEFVNLTQDSMTVLEYERRFSDLSKYAPELIPTPKLKCRRFERGLKPALRNRMVLLGFDDFDALVDRAMTVEMDLIKTKTLTESRRSRGTGGQHEVKPSRKRQKGSTSAAQGFQSQSGGTAPRPPRRSEGTAAAQPLCYHCRQPGHMRSDCPLLMGQGGQTGSARGGSGADTRACYRCGQPGHIQRFCPQLLGGTSGRTGQTGQSSQSSVQQQQTQPRGTRAAQSGALQSQRGAP